MFLLCDDIFYIIISFFDQYDCNVIERTNKQIMDKLYDRRNLVFKISSANNFCLYGLLHAVKLFYNFDYVFGKNEIKLSIIKNNYDVLKYICKKINTQEIYDNFFDILNVACKYGHLNIVKFITKNYSKNECFKHNNDFINLFYNACNSGNLKLIKYLCKINNINNSNKCNHFNRKKNKIFNCSDENNKSQNNSFSCEDFQFKIQNNVCDINSIIDILISIVKKDMIHVMFFLIKKSEECYNNILFILFMCEKYDMIKYLVEKHNIQLTYILLNNIYNNVIDIYSNNINVNKKNIFEYLCSKIKVNKLKRCTSHVNIYGKIMRCNNIAYDCNYMCIDHMTLHTVKIDEKNIHQLEKCVFCEFKSNILIRCKNDNNNNGLCFYHSKNKNIVNKINKYILMQLHFDVVLIKKRMDMACNIYNNKPLKIKKMIYLVKYISEHIIIVIGNEKFKKVLKNKIQEFIDDRCVNEKNKNKFKSYLDKISLL